MTDYSDIIHSSFGGSSPALPAVVGNIDEDPDRAQRAMDLAKATGVNSSAIFGDLDEFERNQKTQLASGIVSGNPHLADFVQSNPMVPKIANDDYGTLDAVSDKIHALKLGLGFGAMANRLFPGDPLARWKEGGPLGSWLSDTDLKNHPFASAVAATIATPIELLFRGVGGAISTASDAAVNLTGQRDLGALVEAEAMGLTGRGHPMEPYEKARPYLENAREPLPTALPEYDTFRAKQNADDLAGLSEATSEAQRSLLRERNPDLFRQFVASHTDAEIGISGEAVAALYGDKVPEAGDGLLGWVPGIAGKLELARATGDDVRVPIADWLANIDPAIERGLKDDIRVRPNGITSRETQINAESALQAMLSAPKSDLKPIPDNLKFNFRDQTNTGYSTEPATATLTNEKGLVTHEMTLYPTIKGEDGLTYSVSDQKGTLAGMYDKFQDKNSGLEKEYELQKVENYSRYQDEKYPGIGPAFYREVARHVEDKYGAKLRVGTSESTSDKAKRAHQVLEDAGYLRRQQFGAYVDAVPSVRAAAALEPMFSVGDRKLELQRLAGAEGSRFGPEQGFHDFSINDEKGNVVGTLNLSADKGGKQIYVENINGLGGLGPRDFGPALMRDLLRQLKAEFPNAESITGHRVSGARGKAGSYMDKSASPVVKLDNPNLEHFGQVLEGGKWEQFSRGIQAYIKPYAERSIEDRNIIDIVGEELDRIAPSKLRVQEVDRIEAQDVEGQFGGQSVTPTGTYIAYRDAYPIILYALEGEDPLGVARHEAIHHLKSYGFFDNQEWSTLEKAAKDAGWMDQFDIHDRYPTAGESIKLEEAIADAYKEWEASKDFEVEPGVLSLFEKMKAFFDRLRERFAQLLGKQPTWEDIFQKVSTGEVGSREGTEPVDPRAFNEKLSVPEDSTGGSRIFERAAALGMTVDQFRRYDELIAQRHAEDIATATDRAKEQQAREQTRQWKDDRKALRQEVAEDIRNRPDVAADLFFGAGELYGKKVPLGSVKIDAEALTAEQKAGLPRNYYGENGLHPDDVANLFGYGSGDVLVERLVDYNRAKLTAGGMSAKDFVSRVTDIETDRQMRIRHGVLEDNIMDAVKEQVSGEVQQNLLAEETLALGTKAGVAPIDKATVVAQLKGKFAEMPLGSVSSDSYLRAAGKAGRAAEMGLLNNDPAAAFVAKQQQWYATVIANEAAKLENDIAKFDKVARRFSKREVPTIDTQYVNFIHDILMRTGQRVRRSVQDLEGEIANGEYKDLQSFVEGKQGFYLREIAVDERLYDPSFRKAFQDLTVDEFRGVDTSIKSLVKNGRDERKITKAGVEADLADIRGQMIEQLGQFQERQYDSKGGRWMGPIPPKIAKVLRTYGTAHIQMENLFNRWDHDDPNGVFQQYVMRDLVDAANTESAMEKRYAKQLQALDDKADLKKSVDNPLFKVPGTEQLISMNRGNLRAILLNVGNDSNLDKLARGYKVPKEQILAWVHQHATKEDWDWAQGMGDIFAELKKESDVMYRHLSGVPAESIPLQPITTPHGEYPGWYYPLIAHSEFEGPTKRMMGPDALEQAGFVRATTSNGYTKARTGVAYPLALDLDAMPSRMKQMIHDIAMRPSVINASKVFYDKDIRSAVFTRFGAEWRDMLVPYLIDVANSANYMPKEQKMMSQASEFMRQNLISTLVGLNPGTVLKHGPTALAQSLHEVGPVNFLRAMKSLFSINDRTGDTNWSFAMNTSEELQRRHQNYVETLGGATDLLQPTAGFGKLRNAVQRFSASPVAISDLLSAVPTWLAQYEKTAGEGATHGDAVYMADRAVRRAHGSVAITNRSGVMRGGALGQWFASVYGFFNHIMNRQYELLWKSGETLGMAKEGNYREAMQRAPELTSMLFAYVIAPALIEEAVTPLASEDGESWGKKAAKGVAFTLGASWVGTRDVANAILNGRDPSVGLISTEAKTITDFARDMGKKAPFNREHAGKVVRDGTTLLGGLTGVVPAQTGRLAQFGLGVAEGTERPKGPWGWMTGARFGTLKGHPGTFQEWQKHHLGVR